MDPHLIAEQLQKIRGTKLQYIHRSCELIELGFGSLTQRTKYDGSEILAATYHIHLQCPFRLTDGREILLRTEDFREPIVPGRTPDLGDCNTCLFDVKAAAINENLTNTVVKDVTVNAYGDLCITLSDLIISVLNTSSGENEGWRFFETGRAPHMVIRGMSLCME